MQIVYIKSSIWSGFEIKNWIEDQFQSSPKLVGIWTVLRCIFVPNLKIVTSIGGELWHGQAHRQTQATTIHEGQNWPRVIKAYCCFMQVYAFQNVVCKMSVMFRPRCANCIKAVTEGLPERKVISMVDSKGLLSITHLSWIMPACISEIGRDWFRQWLVNWLSHYLNQPYCLLGTDFNEILIKIQTFYVRKMLKNAACKMGKLFFSCLNV